jgi:hypothetical protein
LINQNWWKPYLLTCLFTFESKFNISS